MNIILASTSAYRASLLHNLRLAFTQIDPGYTELAAPGEAPGALCRRLAAGKAHSALAQLDSQPNAQASTAPFVIIGSDQVASLPNGGILGKPGNFTTAFAQLAACSGQCVRFETAICLITDTGIEHVSTDVFDIYFRILDGARIRRYLDLDCPWDCAGSIRFESVGISLIKDCRGRDHNSLLGLPLILLVDMLAELNIDVLNEIK